MIDDLPCTTLLTNDSAVVFLGIVVSGKAVAPALQETAGENGFSYKTVYLMSFIYNGHCIEGTYLYL